MRKSKRTEKWKRWKVKGYIYHLSLRTDHLITRSRTHLNECQTISVFSKSTAPRMPSRHVEHHQTMMTARLNGARDNNNTQLPHWLCGTVLTMNEALVCIFFVFLNSFYFTNVSLHVQPSLPPLPPPYYPTCRQQQTRRVQHHTKWRRRVGPLPACHLDVWDADAISSLRYIFFFGIFRVFFFCTNN